jgi:hypothetical protein
LAPSHALRRRRVSSGRPDDAQATKAVTAHESDGPRIVRHKVRQFSSRPDGEYCACNRCLRLGYGEDSWHPLTTEFWPVIKGVLSLTNCRACTYERTMAGKGAHIGMFNATEDDRAWLATAIRRRAISAHRHPGHARSANTTAHIYLTYRSPAAHQSTSHAQSAERSAML